MTDVYVQVYVHVYVDGLRRSFFPSWLVAVSSPY